MQVTTENRIVPKLRFSGYLDYSICQFGDIYYFISTNSFSRDKLNYESGNVRNIHYGDILTKFQSVFCLENENVPLINEEVDLSKYKEENYCKIGDLVIADASEDYEGIGTLIEIKSLNNKMTLAGLHTIQARPYPNKTSVGYVAFLMKSWSVKYQIMRIAQGTKVLGISAKRIAKIKLHLPSLQEQQKIASFLIAVDKKLQQLAKKKELLEIYKEGVVQKIFSQELRFKDDNGKNYSDWEEKNLGDVLVERKEMALKSEGLEHISLTKMGVVPKNKRYMRDFLVNDDSTKKYKLTKLNDICYNPANLKFGVICRNKYGDGIFSPIYITFQIKESSIMFMEYFLVRKKFIAKARKYEQGTVYERMAVHPSDLINLKVELPSLREQQKIANFLSSLDIKIDLVSTQIENTKAFKKGLLQQMFV